MSAGAVVSKKTQFKGIQDLKLIPFGRIQRDIHKGDSVISTSLEWSALETPDKAFYHQNITELSIGTTAFLGYARGVSDETDAFKKGQLVCNLPNEDTPANIGFHLQPCQLADNNEIADKVAQYLTNIAKADGWSTTNSTLFTLYNNFIGQENMMAGSSRNARALVSNLWQRLTDESLMGALNEEQAAIRNKIIARIKQTGVIADEDTKTVTSLGSGLDNYPECLNLPDGSAAIKWVDNAFKPQTSTGTGLNLNDPTRFTYPAELYYYTNSLIRTSTKLQGTVYDRATTTQWNGTDKKTSVLPNYDNNATVQANTRSVAIVTPLNFAVGCLQAVIRTEAGSSSLPDAEGNGIPLTNAKGEPSFPLTAVLVDGQFPQSFNFEPKESVKDDEGNIVEDVVENIIYDKEIPDGIALTASPSDTIYTLVLQSKVDKPATVVLEFTNNSGTEFYGYEGGRVLPGTKFYLAGEVWPPSLGTTVTEDYEQRVFTKDHKTIVTLQVASLRSAYNVIPDLKTAENTMLVVNVAVRNWRSEANDTQNHDLYNW